MKPHIEITVSRDNDIGAGTVAFWDEPLDNGLGMSREPSNVATEAAPHCANGDEIKVLRHNGTTGRVSKWLVVDNGKLSGGVVVVERTYPL